MTACILTAGPRSFFAARLGLLALARRSSALAGRQAAVAGRAAARTVALAGPGALAAGGGRRSGAARIAAWVAGARWSRVRIRGAGLSAPGLSAPRAPSGGWVHRLIGCVGTAAAWNAPAGAPVSRAAVWGRACQCFRARHAGDQPWRRVDRPRACGR